MLELEREIRETHKNLTTAQEQQRHMARIAAAKAAASLPKDRLLEVMAPDGRRLRHRANSYAALQRTLLPAYKITGEIFGADENDQGGFVASLTQSPNALENMLAAYGPSLKRWLEGQAG